MVKKCTERKIELCSQEYCSGCSACYNICPTHSISMLENKLGEIHPVINESSCIACGKCLSVCPNNNDNLLSSPYICYAGWRRNKKSRETSSSGGIAALLSEIYIQKGGIVYGVEYNRNEGVNFNRALTEKKLDNFKGSKYVQATIGNAFQKVSEDLLKGYNVFFVGTPCQVAGLETYISHSACCEKRNNLITADLLCHGVVPQRYLFEEIEYLEAKHGIQADQIIFRSNNPKRNYHFTLLQNGAEVYNIKAETQRYFYCFLHSVTCRESCLHCQYKQKKRIGDITIGDFIGIGKKEAVNLPTEINPSVILINSKRGEQLFVDIASECILIERDFQEAVDEGPSLHGKNYISDRRKIFKKYYPVYGFTKAADKAIYREMHINNILVTSKKIGRKAHQRLMCIFRN